MPDHGMRELWSKFNTCGVCWLGPCMCHKVKEARCELIPAGKDEHMVPVDPLLVRGKTVAFIMDLRDAYVEERSVDLSNTEIVNWWDEHYFERNKLAILKPSVGWRSVKRIAR